MNVHDLPALNASLNGLSGFFIVTGLILIKAGRKKAHIVAMATALVCSVLFLSSYVAYHWLSHGVVTRFTHSGWPRGIYYFILATHVPLAALTVPLVLMTVVPALKSRFERHRAWAKWTVPVWLYVSITGVLVYFMLYRWYPPVAS